MSSAKLLPFYPSLNVLKVNHGSWQQINLKLIVAWWRNMATEIWVNIGSGNGLLTDGTKPLS